LAEFDNRVKRNEVVHAITLKKGSAAIFYELAECKFISAFLDKPKVRVLKFSKKEVLSE
jgi:hypothetical protein